MRIATLVIPIISSAMKTVVHFLISCFFLLTFSAISGQHIELELIQEGFNQPLNIQNAGDERLFIVEKEGKIRVILEDGSLSPTPFLDISGRISTSGEQGLLGLAFHPDYQNNRYFFVNYTDTNGDTRISRFTTNASNPNTADPDSELLILTYIQPSSNHNGGDLAFGPDGFLYISSGDGGGSGDPQNRAQNINEFLGKILRIDIDHPSGGRAYGIPADNPFVGNPDAKEEVWAYGLRNPWRFSIDKNENIWIADVGQGSREEINFQPLSLGGLNYGWRCYEGSLPFNNQNCPPFEDLTFPLAEYDHSGGNCSITGGHVYEGSVYADLLGHYLFADYCSGRIGSVDSDGEMIFYGNFDGRWTSFGRDVHNELYISDISGGKIYKIHGSEIMGIDTPSSSSGLNIFPNPARETVSISSEIERIQKIQLIDLQGREVFYILDINKENVQIPVTEFSSGIYLVKITTSTGKTISKKLMIQ